MTIVVSLQIDATCFGVESLLVDAFVTRKKLLRPRLLFGGLCPCVELLGCVGAIVAAALRIMKGCEKS
jgi:hypothetical protein